MNPDSFLRPFEKSLLTTEKRYWQAKISQLISQVTTHLIFAPEMSLLELQRYHLTPVTCFSISDSSLQAIEASIPILSGKTICWQLDLSTITTVLTTLFIKLGTGNRINQCQLILSIFPDSPPPSNENAIATARLAGPTARDNHWNAFILDRPLPPGRYLCQLQSPDADNRIHTLFLWLTAPYKERTHWGDYRYTLLPTVVLRSELMQLKSQPLLSILLPLIVHEELTEVHLDRCLRSVVQQIYPHWELCITATMQFQTVLENYQRHHLGKIKISYVSDSYYNTALNLASGEYVIILAAGEELTEDALLQIAKVINQFPTNLDMLYSDEDRIREDHSCYAPYFKPDWSPEMLKGQFYTGQLGIYRTRLLKELCGFQEDLYQHPLWDMVLRLTQHASLIYHIPKILYHRRYSSTMSFNKRDALNFVQAALTQEQEGGTVTFNVTTPSVYLLHYPVQQQPFVSIIIPTKDMASMLSRSIEAIRAITRYPHWELIIVDNDSQEEATLILLEKYRQELGATLITHAGRFNFSHLVNRGVQAARGDLILLLNNDTEILGPADWLEEMIGFAQRPAIGAVSCKLLYPQDHTIQHAGLICGIGGLANHSHKHFPAESTGYFDRLAMVSNYSAVSGACLMVKRSLWDSVNGFDENLVVAFNDVDFCLKLLAQGYRHVVLPHVVFYHHESKTRGLEDTPEKKQRLTQEQAYMEGRWGERLRQDPYYNPHLTKHAEDFAVHPGSVYYSQFDL